MSVLLRSKPPRASIPDFYFNHVNTANFRNSDRANLTDSANGVAYFFTVLAESASRNCSGDVVSIQYCYRARYFDVWIGTRKNVFNLLAVDRNGLQFTIISSTPIYKLHHRTLYVREAY